MTKNDPTLAGAAIIEAVENQLRDDNPAHVRKTLARLLNLGLNREEAVKHIAVALSVEVFGALRNSEVFNPERYQRNLDKLPERPQD